VPAFLSAGLVARTSVSSSQPNTAPGTATGLPIASPAVAPIHKAASSICQCRGSIAAPHVRHRPRVTTKLSSGIRSRPVSAVLHESQCDRPRITDRPSGQRITNVAMKLPRIAPSTPRATGQKISVAMAAR
jgi:hypothetical protein